MEANLVIEQLKKAEPGQKIVFQFQAPPGKGKRAKISSNDQASLIRFIALSPLDLLLSQGQYMELTCVALSGDWDRVSRKVEVEVARKISEEDAIFYGDRIAPILESMSFGA